MELESIIRVIALFIISIVFGVALAYFIYYAKQLIKIYKGRNKNYQAKIKASPSVTVRPHIDKKTIDKQRCFTIKYKDK